MLTLSNLKRINIKMDIASIVKLIRDNKQGQLYDFFVIDYDLNKENIVLTSYTVPKEYVMRIDLILENIFESSVDEYYDIFCQINGIVHPLNVMEGDVLFYCKLEDISNFNISALDESYIGSNVDLSNPNKLKKNDSKRSDYVNNNFSLNPNYNSGAPNISVNKNKVTIRKT